MSTRSSTGPNLPTGIGEEPLLEYMRLFTRFLQHFFATLPKGEFQWSDDDKTTDIVIQGEGTVRKEVVEKRPAIIVSRGPIAFTNISMDQFLGYDPRIAKRSHTDLLSASMTYQCLSRSGLEAQRLAWTAAYFTRVEKRILNKFLHRVGEEIQIGSETPPGSVVGSNPGEIIAVSVSVPFYFQLSWSVEPIDKVLLKEIAVTVRSNADYPAPGATILREPGGMRRALRYDKAVSFTSGVKVPPLITPRPRSK